MHMPARTAPRNPYPQWHGICETLPLLHWHKICPSLAQINKKQPSAADLLFKSSLLGQFLACRAESPADLVQF